MGVPRLLPLQRLRRLLRRRLGTPLHQTNFPHACFYSLLVPTVSPLFFVLTTLCLLLNPLCLVTVSLNSSVDYFCLFPRCEQSVKSL